MYDFYYYLSKLIGIFIDFEVVVFVSIYILLAFKIFKLNFIFNLLFYFLFLFVSIIAIFPIGNHFTYKIEHFYSSIKIPDEVNGIIVLSGSIEPKLSSETKQISMNAASERLLYFVKYAKKYENATLVYSGGSSDIFDSNIPSVYAKQYFDISGMKNRSILFENNSRNTYESFANLNSLIDLKINEKWLLITSASHMYRSMQTACKFNLNLIPVPVDYTTLKKTRLLDIKKNITSFFKMVKIYLGIFYYKITNRSC